MNLDSTSPEIKKAPATVSVEQLLEWYAQRRAIAEANSSDFRRRLQDNPGAERDPDFALMGGRIQGATEELKSFGDFLIQASK